MRRSHSITLIETVFVTDAVGNDEREPRDTKRILAGKKSVSQSEFYKASTTDFKPSVVFVVWPHEYSNEKLLRYKGELYSIIRTYEKNARELEIVCEVKMGVK